MFVLDVCGVDTAAFRQEVNAGLGMDLRNDLLGALGSTMGAVVVTPRYGFIPEVSLIFEVRNRAKMEKVLARVTEMCAVEGIRTRQFTVPGGGPKGTYLSLDKQIPFKPAFALSGDKLVVSTMPLTLKTIVSASRANGETIADLLPEATLSSRAPLFSYFVDPAPAARDGYADLLKLLDTADRGLPFEVSSLPEPEFVAAALARFGVEFSADPYFVSIDLHSPAGLAVPLLVGGAMFAQEQQASAAKDPSVH